MNIKNKQRDEYIVNERQKGRSYKDIGEEVGLSAQRVRQICMQGDCGSRKQPEPRRLMMSCGDEHVERFEDFSQETQNHIKENLYTTLYSILAHQYDAVIKFELKFKDGTKKQYRTDGS